MAKKETKPVKRHVKKYHIKSNYFGCKVGTIPPSFMKDKRGVVYLDENLSQEYLEYLFTVIGHEGIEYR